MVTLTDNSDPRTPFFPTTHNILAAMNWLVSEPNCMCFMHYSGHGGLVEDESGMHESGYVDTIVPVDFERPGGSMIQSSLLHRTLVSGLAPGCTLVIIMDCCHSGSAVELPYVYRTDDDGNVNMLDNLRAGAELIGEATHLLRGDVSLRDTGEAQHLLAGATSFFRGLRHQWDGDYDEGLHSTGDGYNRAWGGENKPVFLLSGCKDEQTSADAFIGGRHVGKSSLH
jgi:metacaspase-1